MIHIAFTWVRKERTRKKIERWLKKEKKENENPHSDWLVLPQCSPTFPQLSLWAPQSHVSTGKAKKAADLRTGSSSSLLLFRPSSVFTALTHSHFNTINTEPSKTHCSIFRPHQDIIYSLCDPSLTLKNWITVRQHQVTLRICICSIQSIKTQVDSETNRLTLGHPQQIKANIYTNFNLKNEETNVLVQVISLIQFSIKIAKNITEQTNNTADGETFWCL